MSVEVGHRRKLLVHERVETDAQLLCVARFRRDEELLGADRVDDDSGDLVRRGTLRGREIGERLLDEIRVVGARAASATGRFRLDAAMRVSTAAGTTADTLIGAPIARRSCARHSVAACAANFDTVYGPENAFVHMPAIDVVFTMCAGVPAAIILGTNARMACRMPQRLTPSVHSKSDGGRSHMKPPANTPALLHSTSVAPNVSYACSARASTSA